MTIRIYTSGPSNYVPASLTTLATYGVGHLCPGPIPWLIDHDAVVYNPDGNPDAEDGFSSAPADNLITKSTFALTDGTISDWSTYWGIRPSTNTGLSLDFEDESIADLLAATATPGSAGFNTALDWRGDLVEQVRSLFASKIMVMYEPYGYVTSATGVMSLVTEEDAILDHANTIAYFQRCADADCTVAIPRYYQGTLANCWTNCEAICDAAAASIAKMVEIGDQCSPKPRLGVYVSPLFFGDSGNGYPEIPAALQRIYLEAMLVEARDYTGGFDIILWDELASRWSLAYNHTTVLAAQASSYEILQYFGTGEATCPTVIAPSVPVGGVTLSAGATALDDRAITSGNFGISGGNTTAVTTLSVSNSTIDAFNYGIYVGDGDDVHIWNTEINCVDGGNNYCLRLNVSGEVNINCSTFINSNASDMGKAVFRAYSFTGGLVQNSTFTSTGNGGDDSFIIGGGAANWSDSQIEASGMTFQNCTIDLDGGDVWIGAETHHITFTNVNFTNCGHITCYGADGIAIQDPACHHITFENCTWDGDPLDFEQHFFHGANVQNNAATQNIVIINASGGLNSSTGANTVGGGTVAATGTSSFSAQTATIVSATVNADNTLTIVWTLSVLGSQAWLPASLTGNVSSIVLSLTRSGTEINVLASAVSTIGENGVQLTTVMTLESLVYSTDTSITLDVAAGMFTDEDGNTTPAVSGQSVTNSTTSNRNAFTGTIAVVPGGGTVSSNSSPATFTYMVEAAEVFTPSVLAGEVFSPGVQAAEVFA